MIKLGIIGYPLAHSLSPLMHNAALKAKGIEGEYSLFETQDLKAIVEYFKSNGFRGFNVTIPYKVQIMGYLDSIDDFAQEVGAVNTVVIDENNKLSGYNTDVYGFMNAINVDIKGKKAAVFGTGGASKAAVVGLKQLGVGEISIFGRKDLNEKLDLGGIQVVVNTTPLGMHGELEGQSPLSEYSLDTLDTGAFVYDLVYRPRKTKLLELAEQRGFKTLDGLDMLVLQGAKGFELWTGLEAPVDVMNEVLSHKID